MFSDYEIYGVSQIKKGEGMKPKACSELKAEIDEIHNEPHSIRNIDDLTLRLQIEEYKKKCGNGLVRAGNGLKRSGDGLKRSGEGLKRSGDGLKQAGGEMDDNEMDGGCYDCLVDEIERPKIGQELKELMIKQFCK